MATETSAPPTPLDRDLAALAASSRARGLAPLPQISVAEARDRIEAGNQLCADGPELAEVTDLELAVTGGAIRLRRYSPGATSRATLVYLHGGGWLTGSLGYADELCRFLARDARLTVLSAEYRLAPEHPFPFPLEDAWTALEWAASQLAPGEPLCIGGDSAGGNLAAACTLRARERGPELDLQLLIYPVIDPGLDTPSYRTRARAFPLGRADLVYCWDLYADPELRGSTELAPLRATTHAGLPPAVVVTADHDPLRDEGEAYARALRDAGVPVRLLGYPALCHGFLRFTSIAPAAAAARTEAVAAVAAVLDDGSD